jgi:multiple sugar transport system substrate-binding protein
VTAAAVPPRSRQARARTVALLLAVAALACAREPDPAPGAAARVRLSFRHAPLWGPPEPLQELLAAFERANPGVEVVPEPIPNSTDVAHQLLLTALHGGSEQLDVFVADVVWVAELARAGWIADLSAAFPPERLRAELLPGPVEAAVVGGRTFAVPWYVDVGVLYRRTDLAPEAPRTYAELRRVARAAMARDAALAGFVWQGRQSEALSCNAFEVIWGHGGETQAGDRLLLDTPAARTALAHLRALLEEGLSPATVTSAAEEETRRAFERGGAVFMRNWPYALALLDGPASPVRGKVGVSPLPTADGSPGAGALGGWMLAISARAPPARRAAAERLVAHLTSPDAALVLAVAYGRNPARRASYDDPRLRAGAPHVAALLPMIERARPRPVTPYYGLVADLLQGELSAAVAGLRTPAEALGRAQRQADRIAAEGP